MEGILPMLIYMSHWFQLSTYSTWYCSRDHWKYHCYCSSLHSLQQSCTTVTLLLQHPGILKQQHKGNIWWCPEWHVTSDCHCWSACCSCSIQVIYLGNFRVFFFFFPPDLMNSKAFPPLFTNQLHSEVWMTSRTLWSQHRSLQHCKASSRDYFILMDSARKDVCICCHFTCTHFPVISRTIILLCHLSWK